LPLNRQRGHIIVNNFIETFMTRQIPAGWCTLVFATASNQVNKGTRCQVIRLVVCALYLRIHIGLACTLIWYMVKYVRACARARVRTNV